MRFLSLYVQYGVLGLLTSLSLTGCMVGPDFHPPATPATDSYTDSSLPKKTTQVASVGSVGKTQYYVEGQDIPAEWWTLFHSAELNELIRVGLNNSPNLAAATAALDQARETYISQFASTWFPAVTGQLADNRQRFSTQQFGAGNANTVFDLYNASVSVTYTLDVFGGARRQLEALRAQVNYAAFQLEAAYLTLTSNIVTTAVMTASWRAQIEATHQLIKSQQDQLNIVKRQFDLGGASGADVLTQESQVAQTRATLPPLEQNLAVSQHALSVLVGAFPMEKALPVFSLTKLNLPAQIPVSFPSRLVRQRPDIRASEALLAAASAQVGVATANLYPQFPITGSYGWQSDTTGGFFAPGNIIWNYGASISQPLFNAGALRAKKLAAIDAYNQSLAQYRQTVLKAFQNVADTLRALEHDAQALRAQKQSEIAARKSLAITQNQYRLGGVSYLSLLTAQRQYQQARISLIQAEAARFNDTAALFQSLGGGWWNRCCPTRCVSKVDRPAPPAIQARLNQDRSPTSFLNK
jgi:NodT family efflux transporter outer membrane factor (OMF) lipoprotein